MASGILGTSNPSATTNTTVYTVPSSTLASLSISICNTSSTTPMTVRVALAASGTPGTAEYIEYDTNVPALGVLERTGIVLDATKNVVVYLSGSTGAVVVYGYEEAV